MATAALCIAGTAPARADEAPLPPPPAGPDQQTLDALAAAGETTPGQARARLERQRQLTDRAAQLIPTLDPARTAGLWIDQARGQLVVGVTEPGAAGAGAKDVREQKVEHSTEDLRQAKGGVEQTARALGAVSVSWVVDVRRNTVEVRIPPSVAGNPQNKLFAGQVKALGPPVRVTAGKELERSDKASPGFSPTDPGVLAAGDQIIAANGHWCTVGWLARDAQQGEAVVTAGHCVARNGPDWRHSGTPIGVPTGHSWGPGDWAVFRKDPSAGASRPEVHLNNGNTAPVTGVSSPLVGTMVCKAGTVSGVSCGTVTAHDVATVQGDGTIQTNLVGMRVCADSGDSGGPVYTPNGDGTVTALGMVSNGTDSCSAEPGTQHGEGVEHGMTFQPLDTLLFSQGLTLLTTDPAAPLPAAPLPTAPLPVGPLPVGPLPVGPLPVGPLPGG